MTIIEITALVEKEHSCKLFRLRKGQKCDKKTPLQYDVKDYAAHGGNKRGWAFMDATTAHAMNVVTAALKPENRTRWDTLPLSKLIDFTWSNVR